MKHILIGSPRFSSSISKNPFHEREDEFRFDYAEQLKEVNPIFCYKPADLKWWAWYAKFDAIFTELHWSSEDDDNCKTGFEVLEAVKYLTPMRVVMTTYAMTDNAVDALCGRLMRRSFMAGASYFVPPNPAPEWFGKLLTKPKKVLIIEDSKNHLQDAIAEAWSRPGISPVYARTYQQAAELLHPCCIDGIISDIYFPHQEESDEPAPIGIKVATEAAKSGVPFVLCTAGYHHGKSYQWISDLAMSQGWNLVDPVDYFYKAGIDSFNSEAPKKDWKRAFETLETRMAR